MFVSEYSQVFKAETTSKPVRIFRVVLLFSYQRTLSFFGRFCRPHQRQLVYIIINRFICQELFYFSFKPFFKQLYRSSFFKPSLWCCFQALNCCNARIYISTSEALVWNHNIVFSTSLPSRKDVLYNNMPVVDCQHLFIEFFLFSKKCLQFIRFRH